MPFSHRTMRPEDWAQITHFTPAEFAQPEQMGFEFLVWLDSVRERAGVAMHVSSSYRTPAHNREVGGADDSAHCDVPCNAVDIPERPTPDDPHGNLARFRIVKAAMELGCQRIGSYADGSLHLDMSHAQRPAPRMWRVVR